MLEESVALARVEIGAPGIVELGVNTLESDVTVAPETDELYVVETAVVLPVATLESDVVDTAATLITLELADDKTGEVSAVDAGIGDTVTT